MTTSDTELPASTAPTTSGPRVSVIVTFYNQASFVFGALDSVNDQTADNIQLIITDDGSTDDTASLIDRWVSENRPDAVVVRPPANVGPPRCSTRRSSTFTATSSVSWAATTR